MYITALNVNEEDFWLVFAHLSVINAKMRRRLGYGEEGILIRWDLAQSKNAEGKDGPVSIRVELGRMHEVEFKHLGEWESLSDAVDFKAFPDRKQTWTYSIATGDDGLVEMLCNTLSSTFTPKN